MRLIDADALSKDLEKRWNVNDDQDFRNKEVWHALEEAPTIEPDSDTISRSRAIKDVSEWATDILHPDRLVKEDAIHILESLPSAEQVTGKLKNPCDSLLTADSEACKEQKSKLDLISRQAAIAMFEKHCYPITYNKTSRENGMTITGIREVLESLPSAQPSGDLISRQAVIELIKNSYYNLAENMDDVWAMVHDVEQLPSAPDSRQRGEWVGCTGCEHYDQQQTSLICHDCRRYYSDKYKGGEEE